MSCNWESRKYEKKICEQILAGARSERGLWGNCKRNALHPLPTKQNLHMSTPYINFCPYIIRTFWYHYKFLVVHRIFWPSSTCEFQITEANKKNLQQVIQWNRSLKIQFSYDYGKTLFLYFHGIRWCFLVIRLLQFLLVSSLHQEVTNIIYYHLCTTGLSTG